MTVVPYGGGVGHLGVYFGFVGWAKEAWEVDSLGWGCRNRRSRSVTVQCPPRVDPLRWSPWVIGGGVGGGLSSRYCGWTWRRGEGNVKALGGKLMRADSWTEGWVSALEGVHLPWRRSYVPKESKELVARLAIERYGLRSACQYAANRGGGYGGGAKGDGKTRQTYRQSSWSRIHTSRYVALVRWSDRERSGMTLQSTSSSLFNRTVLVSVWGGHGVLDVSRVGEARCRIPGIPFADSAPFRAR
ncbi:hypothetical protein FA13DRAFT_1179539 [Coprinellus micaceus]|uniref:Uncharacterized protein n=1 Tax=Coprinellus micaceus TaxID=71717 RepID=A0A4Y7SUD4_COPMI|nr:hypothetical protein FA13DRAFT_1179539 [Coprinellus micaceus]